MGGPFRVAGSQPLDLLGQRAARSRRVETVDLLYSQAGVVADVAVVEVGDDVDRKLRDVSDVLVLGQRGVWNLGILCKR